MQNFKGNLRMVREKLGCEIWHFDVLDLLCNIVQHRCGLLGFGPATAAAVAR